MYTVNISSMICSRTDLQGLRTQTCNHACAQILKDQKPSNHVQNVAADYKCAFCLFLVVLSYIAVQDMFVTTCTSMEPRWKIFIVLIKNWCWLEFCGAVASRALGAKEGGGKPSC